MKTRAAWWLLYFAVLFLAALSGCQKVGGESVAPAVSAMGGAHAEGSGASLTPPPASAGPSEQFATEETVYAPAEPAAPPPADPPPSVVFHPPGETPAAEPAPVVQAPAPAAPRPVLHRSTTYTRIAPQQEVAPMLKQVGGFLSALNRAHWLGLCAIIVGLGGILHAAGNKESGYPVVWLKVFGAGVVAVVMGTALWFWILLGLAFLLFAAQKLGVLRPLP